MMHCIDALMCVLSMSQGGEFAVLQDGFVH